VTATEDRMRQAFDKAMFHNSPTIMRVQIAADVADQMVAEATAALRKQHAELLAALREVREWIRNWDPNFTQDEEWPATRAKMDAAIAAAEASGTGDRP